MSTEVSPCRTLGEYVEELVVRLSRDDPAAFDELRCTVGSRSATIGLDAEVVSVRFRGRELVLGPSTGSVEGAGSVDGHCVLDLLDGYDDVTPAILDGRLRVQGAIDDVLAMFAAIEIILDVSARSPALQALSHDLRADPCRSPRPPRLPGDFNRSTAWRFNDVVKSEAGLLAKLDLLPDDYPRSSGSERW